MKLEHVLVGVLLQKPATGYDLKKHLDSFGRVFRSKTQMSQVYRSLAKMEDDGWILHTVEPRPGAQDAKVYRVTAAGTAAFLDWLKGPYRPPVRFQEPEFSARLTFAGFMTTEEVIALLDTEITTREDEIARYRFRDRRVSRAPSLPFDEHLADVVGQWAHQTGVAAMDAHVASCKALRATLLGET